MRTALELIQYLDISVGLVPNKMKSFCPEDIPVINQWVGQRKLVDSLIGNLEDTEKRQVFANRYEKTLDHHDLTKE